MNSHKIQLISGPRNISTAIMYSFGNRKSCHIIDEPFYAYYLQSTGIDHPGREEIMESQSTDSQEIIKKITSDIKGKKEVFIKNMAHHFIGLNPKFALDFKNILLIRDPGQILSSFAKVIPNPTIDDIGIKKEWELYQYLKKNDNEPIVVDSGILLSEPEGVLRKLCLKINIPYESAMLSWQAGPRKEDGVWAKYWYKNVHLSSSFKKQQAVNRELPENLKQVNEEAYIYYSKLYNSAINA